MTSPVKHKFIKIPHISFGNIFKEIGRSPHVDWAFTLIVNTTIAAILIGMGVYLYVQIEQGKFNSTEKNSQSSSQNFNKKDLDALMTVFDEKARVTQEAKRGYTGPKDPSL